jgi:hypothetical protein
MREKLESKASHLALVERSDGVELLKNIRSVMCNFQSQKSRPLAIHDAKRRFCTMSQDRHATCQTYLDRFNNCVEVIEHSRALIGIEPGLVDATMATASPPMTRETATELEMAAAEAYTRDKYLACAFLIEDLENDYTMANDKYPKSMTTLWQTTSIQSL